MACENCPICGTSGNQEEVCDHFILAIWDENFGDSVGAPVWMPLHIGKYAERVKDALDGLFESITRSPGLIGRRVGRPHLRNLLQELHEKSREGWQENYENLSDFVGCCCDKAFNRYLQGIYRLASDADLAIVDVISHSPGLDWTTIYLWSHDPEGTTNNMIRLIEEDVKQLRGAETDTPID